MHTYIYIYIERERDLKREREREKERERETGDKHATPPMRASSLANPQLAEDSAAG